MIKNKNIEVEGGELILKNTAGDYVVIPKKQREEVKQMLSEDCNECIDELVSTLPVLDDYAEDGTLVPTSPDNPPLFPNKDIVKDNTKNFLRERGEALQYNIQKKKEGYKEPENKGVISNAIDWVSGNIDEHIITPIVSTIDSEYKPEFDVQKNKYDNTPGKLKNLKTSSLEDIEKEKNISQAQVNSDFMPITQSARNKHSSSIYPLGYDPKQSVSRYKENWKNEKALSTENLSEYGKRAEAGDTKAQRRIDANLYYSGMPQRYDTFTVSKFSAGKDKAVTLKDTPNNRYLKYGIFKDSAIKTDLYKKLSKGELSQEYLSSKEYADLSKTDKPNKHGFQDKKGNIMWNATYGVNYDKNKENMPYVSFYDKWDLATGDVLGTPYDVYDRMYLDEQTISDYSKYNYVPDNMSESDISESLADNEISNVIRNKSSQLDPYLTQLRSSDNSAYRQSLGFTKEVINYLEKTMNSTEIEDLITREQQRLVSYINKK